MSDFHPKNAKFSLGQIVYHSKFKYRGVIVDADPNFQGLMNGMNQLQSLNQIRINLGTTCSSMVKAMKHM